MADPAQARRAIRLLLRQGQQTYKSLWRKLEPTGLFVNKQAFKRQCALLRRVQHVKNVRVVDANGNALGFGMQLRENRRMRDRVAFDLVKFERPELLSGEGEAAAASAESAPEAAEETAAAPAAEEGSGGSWWGGFGSDERRPADK